MPFHQKISIGSLTITPRSVPLFIAELGINHNGGILTAKELVLAAKEAGADIAKFQCHIPDAEMVPNHPLWEVLKSCSFDLEEELELKEFCEENEIVYMSTPFSLEAVDRLTSMGVQAFKTGSGELNHLPLQRKVAECKLPTFISTGMSTIAEVHTTAKLVKHINPDTVFMNCLSIYPAEPSLINLRRIDTLREMGCMVGQSDHSPTISTALGAIGRGAVAIEKHLTLDRHMPGPDHSGSLLPEEFRQMVELGTEIGLANQADGRSWFHPGERVVRDWANHYLITAKQVEEGEDLSPENVTYKRIYERDPDTVIPAAQGEDYTQFGFFSAALPANSPIRFSDVGLYPQST